MADFSFLSDFTARPVVLPTNCPFQAISLILGKGNLPLEVLVLSSNSEPRLPELRSCWKARNAGRPAPLLVVVLYENRAALCGATGDDPPAFVNLEPGQIERICREALEQEDRHAALRTLRDSLLSVQSELAGLRNEGYLATHELMIGVRERSDWKSSGDKARRVLSKPRDDLLQALGFQVERYDGVTSILKSKDRKIALAVLLLEYESVEIKGGRFWGISRYLQS